MNACLRWLFFTLFVRPLVFVLLGLSVRHRERLPTDGPVILCANHNSHLDALVLMSLFPRKRLPRLRAAAAADYFLCNRLLGWFATNVIGIVPLDRTARTRGLDPLAPCDEALERGETLILFPEGTRGEPEVLAPLKKGIAWLAERHPEVPIVPVFLHVLGKALPKGGLLPVPFNCEVLVGESIPWRGSREGLMEDLNQAFGSLAGDVPA